MPAYKDSKTGKWYTSFYYTNWNGVREKKMKRGFETKKAALEWERDFLMKSQANLDMRFDSFVELYIEDLQHRIKCRTDWGILMHEQNQIAYSSMLSLKDRLMVIAMANLLI